MRPILTIVVLLGLAGCSGDAVGQPGSFGRLDVTPTLQVACAGFVGGDPFLNATIQVAEEARLVGVPYHDLLDVTIDGCETEACLTCHVAILNQVYGI